MDPSYRPRYLVTTGRLKVKFRDIRALLTNSFYNFQHSGIGDKESDRKEDGSPDDDEDAAESAVVTIPDESQHDGVSSSKCSRCLVKRV